MTRDFKSLSSTSSAFVYNRLLFTRAEVCKSTCKLALSLSSARVLLCVTKSITFGSPFYHGIPAVYSIKPKRLQKGPEDGVKIVDYGAAWPVFRACFYGAAEIRGALHPSKLAAG